MLNERISQNSMAGSVRVIRYLLTALSTSFIGAGLVRFAYTPLLPVLIESRWFDTSACSGRSKRGCERADICWAWPGYCGNRHVGPLPAAIRFAGDVDLVSRFRGCFNGFNLDVLAPFGVHHEKRGGDSPSPGTFSSRLPSLSDPS